MNSLAVSVRVASDVVEDLSRSGEWRFRVHNPVGLARRREVTGKGLAIGQGREGPGEAELPRVERVLKRLEQQPAKQAREHPDGQEEAGAAGDPTGAIGGQVSMATENRTFVATENCTLLGRTPQAERTFSR